MQANISAAQLSRYCVVESEYPDTHLREREAFLASRVVKTYYLPVHSGESAATKSKLKTTAVLQMQRRFIISVRWRPMLTQWRVRLVLGSVTIREDRALRKWSVRRCGLECVYTTII